MNGRPPRLLELFSGTGSVGRAFRALGWEVTSLDLDPKAGASITADVCEWDASPYPPGHFDFVWASPVCTEFSRAMTRRPRDLEAGDRLVLRTLELIGQLRPRHWAIENPATGLLKTREYMQGLPFVDVTYCSYGFGYRKPTRIWTYLPWTPSKGSRCAAFRGTAEAAQRGSRVGPDGKRDAAKQTQKTLYSMPPSLCLEIAERATDLLPAPNEPQSPSSSLEVGADLPRRLRAEGPRAPGRLAVPEPLPPQHPGRVQPQHQTRQPHVHSDDGQPRVLVRAARHLAAAVALLVHLQLHEAVGQAEELVRALQAAAPGHRAVPHDRFGALEGRAELPLDLRQDQMLPLHPQREPRWLERREAAPAEAGAVLGPVVAGRRLAEVDVGAAAARAAAVLQAARAGVLRQQPAARLGAEPPAAVRLAAVEAGLRGAAAAGVGAAHAAAVADAPAPRGCACLGQGAPSSPTKAQRAGFAPPRGAAEAAALLRAQPKPRGPPPRPHLPPHGSRCWQRGPPPCRAQRRGRASTPPLALVPQAKPSGET
ncbi:unnamed protein product [Symbiodinium natans]|uniref:Uncharacterized protein n=1 Tax=Symbiodinium natans TaxID=878477 RepID=A0A812PMJ0_9DINO|nr:unnamed protein product [Symbiodinium natans]